MKVLFAMGNDLRSKNVVDRYYERYGEILEYKNIFYFKSLLEEVKNNKTYDRIVINEELEEISTNDIQQIDNYIFNNIDKITDEIQDADIILVCSDRRTKGDAFVNRLFSIGIYNLLIGNDRNINPLCDIIKKPKTKREAKQYLNINISSITSASVVADDEVDEIQMQNILHYYEGIKNKPEEYVSTFDKIAEQYSRKQLKIIVNFLPQKVRDAVLAENRYKYLAAEMRENAPNVSTPVEGGGKTGKPKKASGGLFTLFKKERKSTDKHVGTMEISREQNSVSIKVDNDLEQVTEAPATNPSVGAFNGEKTRVELEQQNKMQAEQQAFLAAKAKAEVEARERAKMEEQVALAERAKKEAEAREKAKMEEQAALAERAKKEAEAREKTNMSEQAALVERAKKEAEAREKAKMEEQAALAERAKKEAEAREKTNMSEQAALVERAKKEAEAREKAKMEEQAALAERAKKEAEARENAKVESQTELTEGEKREAEDIKRAKLIEKAKAEAEARERAKLAENMQPSGQAKQEEKKEEQVLIANNAEMEAKKQAEMNAKLKAEAEAKAQAELMAKVQAEAKKQAELIKLEQEKKLKEEQEKLVMEQNKIREAQAKLEEEKRRLREEQERLISTQDQIYKMQTDAASVVYTNNKITQMVSAENKKMVVFVGSNKVGTTFVTNAIAHSVASAKVKTAILDMARDKSMYYLYNQNDKSMRKKAAECMQRLSDGEDWYLDTNNNFLKVYTTVPGAVTDVRKGYKHKSIIDTVIKNNTFVIVDADFTTPIDYFEQAAEIYIIQDLDLLKMPDVTLFLRELKNRGIDMRKIRIIINKYIKTSLTPKQILQTLSYYSDPEMSFVDELLPTKLDYAVIPYNLNNYAKYVDSICRGVISYKGYSEEFLQTIDEISQMVYPRVSSERRAKRGFLKS